MRLHRQNGLGDTEMSREPAAMEFPDKKVAGGSGRYAETVAVEKKSNVDSIVRVFGGDLVPKLAEIWAVFINKQ